LSNSIFFSSYPFSNSKRRGRYGQLWRKLERYGCPDVSVGQEVWMCLLESNSPTTTTFSQALIITSTNQPTEPNRTDSQHYQTTGLSASGDLSNLGAAPTGCGARLAALS
jgi:hypothetical protein